MTEREALKLALEGAANYIDALGGDSRKYRQALAEQPAQQEGCQCPACQVLPHASDCAVHNGPAYPKGKCDCGVQQEPVAITITGKLGNIYSFTGDYSLKKGDKVYTTPPQRTWVGLTDEEQQELYNAWMQKDDGWGSFYTLIEAKLKEKNT